MPWLLSVLLGIGRESLNFAKFVVGLTKVALLRVALSARAALVYVTQYLSWRGVFLATSFALFEAAIASLAFLVATPLTSQLLRYLLPDNEPFAQGIYYIAWEEGIKLSLVWSLTLVYWANVFVVRRALNLLASALSYRMIIWDGQNTIFKGLMGGR